MKRNSVIRMVAWIMVISLSQVFAIANGSGSTNKTKTASETVTAAASLEAPLGRLVADGPVTVNGVKARTGDTVFPGARIQTVAGTGVTIQVGRIGQIDIAPETQLVLNFDRGSIHSAINTGCAMLVTNDGIQGSLTMPGGLTKQNDPLKRATLSACSDGNATTPVTGAKSVRMGTVSPGAITLGPGSVSFAEFGSMMLGSTAMLTGLNSYSSQPVAAAAATGNCCCCCCCCNPSISVPCI